ncbi:Uncharacterised protein [Kingella potus]|uniref:Uncharacterized protein n=1 Tax=Kingella potus TaxID=265175 RepID=A0A377R5B1_9NEIS|nr:Uncharacterised protein [Kingella potus]
MVVVVFVAVIVVMAVFVVVVIVIVVGFDGFDAGGSFGIGDFALLDGAVSSPDSKPRPLSSTSWRSGFF